MSPSVLFVGPMLGVHPGWVPNPAEHLAPLLEKEGVVCSLVSSKQNRYMRLLDILRTIWNERVRTDMLVLQVYSGRGFALIDIVSFFASILGVPMVMALHGGDLPLQMKRSPGWSIKVFKRAHTLVAPSEFIAEAVLSLGFEVVIIPNAIDIDDYPFTQRQRALPNLLWMRTFHDLYNPLMAVNVFARIKKIYPKAQLTMAGQEKGMLDAVRHSVNELGLDQSVRFVGFLDPDSKKQEFASHDIFLNTNRVDNMPVSLIEAAAFGIPIVATEVGGVPYLFKDGLCGKLVPDNDVNAMVDAIQHLIVDPAYVENCSRQNRAFAKNRDWSTVLPQWKNLIMSIFEKEVLRLT